MSVIVLTAAQVQVLREAVGPVEVRDEHGLDLGRILPSEAAIVAEAKRRLAAGGPRSSSADVGARLKKLQEISEREQLDEARVKDLLRRMRAGEEV